MQSRPGPAAAMAQMSSKEDGAVALGAIPGAAPEQLAALSCRRKSVQPDSGSIATRHGAG